MVKTDPHMKIRLPAALKAWLEAEARRNCRTQNGEIVFRLEEACRAQAERTSREATPAAGLEA